MQTVWESKCPKQEIYISELILVIYEYTPRAYVTLRYTMYP